ncbi:trypsin-like peptidase domain-containing protein [Streptomyces sp. NBC_00193]|uniref:trypsin-like serine peptidase n=1 Tax=Streptomyces sp. NBC_00193 TaxID=2975675 RepID=UPI002254A904|nr:trypsin-like serine protease [Streptomyces sp. NBC_00193]MCX5300132.1 trypsin-like peptidase domain-containing protein [Streptomyces sp. NBC_00193]
MIQCLPSRPDRRSRARARGRRAARILLALAAMTALLSVDVPDASAEPPLGVTVTAAADGTAGRVGALFAGGLDGGHFCTASVVRSQDRDVIVTAAHCLGSPGTTVFAPGYRDGEAPYGLWKLTGTYVAPGWADGEDPDEDIAFATVTPVDGGQADGGQADGRRIEDVVGGFPVAAQQPADATVSVVGYPSGDESPLYCANTTTLFSETQRRIECPDLSGGTSGSPWLVDGALAGVLGGHEGGGTVPEVSYSAVMGDQAVELYREASDNG